MLVRYDNGKGKLVKKILKQGDCFHFPPYFVHQEEAITDCEIIEVSTPHFNDRVRVEKIWFNGEWRTSDNKKVKLLKNKKPNVLAVIPAKKISKKTTQ